MASSTQNSTTKLKEEGNELFEKKEYERAEEKYSEAIQIDPLNHTLFGNRSACRLFLERYEEALQDAEEAIRLDPTYVKGYHRRALCFEKLENYFLMKETYERAAQYVSGTDKWLQERLKYSDRLFQKFMKKQPVRSEQHMIKIFENIKDNRERLCTLAFFWNLCSPEQRRRIFLKFLDVISEGRNDFGSVGGPDDFLPEHMLPFPLDNYLDIEPISFWLDFFQTLADEPKVQLFHHLWEKTTDQEKDLIIRDFQFFFLKPRLEDHGLAPSNDVLDSELDNNNNDNDNIQKQEDEKKTNENDSSNN